MRIIVKHPKGPNIYLPIPSGIFLNRAVARIIAVYLRKHGMKINMKQMDNLIREFNTCRRRIPNWILVEAECDGGEYVMIRL